MLLPTKTILLLLLLTLLEWSSPLVEQFYANSNGTVYFTT